MIDDDDFLQMMVKTMGGMFGLVITPAVDGNQGIAIYRERHSDFKLVLMDFLMPECDGIEATKKIREFEAKYGLAPIKIYGLTGDMEEQNKGLHAGMNKVFEKPLKKPDFEEIVQDLK